MYIFLRFSSHNNNSSISNNNIESSQLKNLPDSHPPSSNSSKPTLTYARAATNQISKLS